MIPSASKWQLETFLLHAASGKQASDMAIDMKTSR
jgi:hypothetical protein